MNLEEAFLREVIEHPDDDGPRLVYADWLEENGDPARAEFIRVQCQLARLPEDDPRRPALQKRERALLARHRKEWFKPFRGLDLAEWQWQRGFIERVEMYASDTTVPDRMERLTSNTPVRTLRVQGELLDASVVLAAAPHFRRLRELEFPYTEFAYHPEAIGELFTSPHVTGLTSLSLVGGRSWGWFSDGILCAIVTSPSLAGLTRLTLYHDWHGLSRRALRTLAGSPQMANLTRLGIEWCRTDRPTAEALASSPHLTRLTELNLRHARLSEPSWRLLLASPNLAGLKRLRLFWADVLTERGRHSHELSQHPPRQAFLDRFGPEVVDFESPYDEPWKGYKP
jgi:uncharacterized protein (TIGR02996 family)